MSRRPSLGFAAGMWVVVAGWVIGLRSLADNSFFTHLATGRLILERGSVPTADPYSFTAAGEPWVVQSWLASVLYATTESLGGAVALRILMGLTAAVLAAVAWRLTSASTSVAVRLALGALFIAVNAELWSERPLMIGLIALALTISVVEGRLDARWLLPIGWVWVNSHGSFPLGVVYLAVCYLGARLDGADPSREWRACGFLVAGCLLGAIGPLGPRILLFPAELLQRRDVLSSVIEWQAPTFESFSQRMWLVQLALAIVLVARRPSYRSALLIAVFGVAALLGSRNLAVASLVWLPVLAGSVPSWGSLRSTARTTLGLGLAVAAGAALLVLGAARLEQPDYRLDEYPVDATAYLEGSGIDPAVVRLAAPDIVGNFRELIYGVDAEAFYDDRFDMFPKPVAEAHGDLIQVPRRLERSLERFDVDLVMWNQDAPVVQRLAISPSWRVLYMDEAWALLCRRGTPLGGEAGAC